ncbi:hypothetical protein C100_18870 [Sphingobium sp. C100]|nr:hypothetical protein C100_18870 [Sphingobium sp. C100]
MCRAHDSAAVALVTALRYGPLCNRMVRRPVPDKSRTPNRGIGWTLVGEASPTGDFVV